MLSKKLQLITGGYDDLATALFHFMGMVAFNGPLSCRLCFFVYVFVVGRRSSTFISLACRFYSVVVVISSSLLFCRATALQRKRDGMAAARKKRRGEEAAARQQAAAERRCGPSFMLLHFVV